MMKTKPQSILACLICAIVVLNIVPSAGCLNNLNVPKKPAKLKKYLDNFQDPVIGILTQPLSKLFKKQFGNQYQGYIASSYKKWVE